MVFNWHASLRMPGSEPSLSLACQGFPTRSHTRKACVLMFPPFYTSLRLLQQEYTASAPNMGMGCTCDPSSGCIGLVQTRNVPRGAQICLVPKASIKEPSHGLGKGSLTNPWWLSVSLLWTVTCLRWPHYPSADGGGSGWGLGWGAGSGGIGSRLFLSLAPWLPNDPLLFGHFVEQMSLVPVPICH